MKKIIVNILHKLGQLLYCLKIEQLARIFSFIRNHVYTGYLRNRFHQIGNDSIIYWKAYHLQGIHNVSIGRKCTFEAGLELTTWPKGTTNPTIKIGDNCLFRKNAHITATQEITIGENLLTGTNVFITDNSHGLTDKETLNEAPRIRPIVSKGKVRIGNNVWLGNNVCILPGVTIGDGCIIGANSVVTHNIPPYSVVGGVPAKIIK